MRPLVLISHLESICIKGIQFPICSASFVGYSPWDNRADVQIEGVWYGDFEKVSDNSKGFIFNFAYLLSLYF